MANTSSAKKKVRVIARKTAVLKHRRSRMNTLIKGVVSAIAQGDKDKALTALKGAQPEIVRAAQKGIMHKRTASRRVSRLAKAVAKIS